MSRERHQALCILLLLRENIWLKENDRTSLYRNVQELNHLLVDWMVFNVLEPLTSVHLDVCVHAGRRDRQNCPELALEWFL